MNVSASSLADEEALCSMTSALVVFVPSDILFILNWLSAALTEGGSENKIHFSRAFSPPMRLACKDGICEIMSIGGVLNLDLVHSMDASWSQMQDVRLFLYEVVGRYSPPLSEDVRNDEISQIEKTLFTPPKNYRLILRAPADVPTPRGCKIRRG